MTPELVVRTAVDNVSAKVVYEKNWNSAKIAGKGAWSPKFVMLHHTAGSSSLGLLRDGNPYRPVRGAHFLIDRDGTVHVLACVLAYHAGKGGPKWGVAAGMMNHYAWGIEIEDLGRAQSMTPAQIKSAAQLAAGLLKAMGRDLDCLIQHREWNPVGKVDTRYSSSFWHEKVAAEWPKPPKVTAAAVSKPKRLGLSLDKWPIGKRVMDKVGAHTDPNWFTVQGGDWVTLAIIDLPAGGSFGCELQVRMPRGVAAGEARLGRMAWGDAGPGQIDDTGHNPIPAAGVIAGVIFRWRTPINHNIVGGGPLAYQIFMPPGVHKMRFVAKAVRTS